MPKDKKVKQPLETNVSITYTNETAHNVGNVDNAFCVSDNTYEVTEGGDTEYINYRPDFDNAKIYEIRDVFVYEGVTYNENAQYLLPYGLNTLQEQLNSGKNINQVHSNLVQSLVNEKSNPQILYYIITFLEDQLSNLYDSNKGHLDLGKSSLSMLENILTTKRHDELGGFVCMNIHEFGMRLLHDCEINAVVISGKSTSSVSHACLLYQVEDGKFAFTNYGRTVIINANNIKEAALVVNKVCKSTGLENFGSISFLDDDCSYQEFALKDETVWGHEIDKKEHNFESPFSFKMDGKTAVDGSFNISNMGSLSGMIQGTLAYGNGNVERETTFGISMQKRGQTALFDNSKSAGLKLGHKFLNNKNGLFMSAQAIVAHTTGNVELENTSTFMPCLNVEAKAKQKIQEHTEKEVNYNELDENAKQQIDNYYRNHHIDNPFSGEKNPVPEPKDTTEPDVEKPVEKPNVVEPPKFYTTEHTITSLQAKVGKQFKLLETPTTQLSNVTQTSLTGYFDLATTGKLAGSGDCRLAVEDGFQFTNLGKNGNFSTYASLGILGDLKYTGGAQAGGVQLGLKANAGMEAGYNFNNGLSLDGSIDTYLVETKPTTEKGIMARIGAAYKPSKSNVSFFGNVSAKKESQQLRIGGFNQLAEDTRNIGVTLGMQNPNGSLSVSYNNSLNKINSTYDRQTVTLNVRTTPQSLCRIFGIK